MATKTVSAAVVGELRKARLTDEAVYFPEQMDPEVYKQVKALLEGMGAFWEKARGRVGSQKMGRWTFANHADPRPLLEPYLQADVARGGEIQVYTVVGIVTTGECYCKSFSTDSAFKAQVKAQEDVEGPAGTALDAKRLLLVAGVFDGARANYLDGSVVPRG